MTRLLGSARLAIILAAFVAGSAYYIGHAPTPQTATASLPGGLEPRAGMDLWRSGAPDAGKSGGSETPEGIKSPLPFPTATAVPGGPSRGVPAVIAVASGVPQSKRKASPSPKAQERPKWPVATTVPGPRPVPQPVGTGALSGVQYAIRASWYCGHGSRCTVGHPGGMYAAISPDLRVWAGRHVRVCYQGRCVVVTVIDCLCSREHGIDLYSEPFGMLAPLSVGIITVTLEAVG